MAEPTETWEPPYNSNKNAMLVYVDGVDEVDPRMPIYTLMEQIDGMDMSPEQRMGHRAGLLAAQLTLDYLDRNLHPVHERALEVGMLATLGCFITDRVPLAPAEMDYAETYQRVILFTRILEDLQPEPQYEARRYASIEERWQQRIRLNLLGYSRGREGFSACIGETVQDFKDLIHSTPPTGADITAYRDDQALLPVVDRFAQLKRSLHEYVPTLEALDDELWQYARTHYVRNIRGNENLPPLPAMSQEEDERLAAERREAVIAAFFVLQ